jgi:hypothetical protein
MRSDKCPTDLGVLLARASAEGGLQLLTRGWERTLGYRPEQLSHMTLMQLKRSSMNATCARWA